MVRVTRFTLFLVTLLLATACWPLSLTSASVTQPLTMRLSPTVAVVTPQFLRTACLYRIPPDANVTCGYLLVLEDRSQPTAKTIRLHVVIFKSSSSAPAADPLILLNGGPGSPGQPMVEAMLYDLVGEV